jgi:ParB-like chromosome segregation protein Spo0J
LPAATAIHAARQIEHWPLTRLQPYDRNARTHSPEQIQQIAASIREFGFTNPILVDGNDGIIAGHGRLMAAQQLSMPTVPVVILDHLTDAQRRAYVLADNKLALNAGWDDLVLAAELQTLQAEDFDLDLLGWSADELATLLTEPEFPPGTEDDQGQLDQTLPKEIDCRCPACGHEFIQQV